MDLTRRDFIKAAALASVAAAAATNTEVLGTDVAQAATKWAEGGVDEWVKSVCRFCGTGCGVELGITGGKFVALRGDQEHPTTKGLVCAKALFLPKIVYSKDRLTTPQIRNAEGVLEDATWDEAMDLVADKFAEAIEENGPNSVAYYGSGQALTEESYYANRLFKGGIGTNNVEGNPRLCMASAVGGYVSTYGKDEPMGSYDDIDHAQTFFLIGSNTTECHPVIFNRILERYQTGNKIRIILCDPRKNPIGKIASVHLDPIAGYDLALFHSMAQVIIDEGLHDEEFINNHTVFKKKDGDDWADATLDEYITFLEDFTPKKAEELCGVPAAKIKQAAKLFAKGPTMSFWTMGLNQRQVGVWANNLIHNLHLITGNIGKPGATPFSLTGQPNACGGVRDTGTLSHLLPYGRVVANEDHRKQIEELWGAEPGTIQDKPGLHTIAMFDAMKEGDIKAMLVLTTNPGQSLPDLTPYREAMASKDSFMVVLDAYPTRTTELADVVLPAGMWSEKEGVFGMSERRYQLMEELLTPPGEAKPDLDILMDFAARLEERGVVPKGYIADKFETSADVWEEIQLASKDTPYDFMGITRDRLHAERGVRWPAPTEDHPGTSRRYVKGEDPMLDAGPWADDTLAEGDVKFYAKPEGKAVIWMRPMKGPAEPANDEYPFILTTGRVIEHWHTGTMTRKAPELDRAQPAAYVEINPKDAEKLDIQTGDMVKITSIRGDSTVKARVIDTPREGMVFVPWHWEEEAMLINRVTVNAFDPGSKQPEFKVCAVQLAKA